MRKSALILSIFLLLLVFVAEIAQSSTLPTIKPNAYEKALLRLVNNKRKATGRNVLKRNRLIALAARRHSQDMIDNNYFGHTSPSGARLPERLRQSGLQGWGANGENLARAASAKRAFSLWLKSPRHKRNMLKNKYTHVGIGIIPDGPYGLMITLDMVEMR